MPLLDFSTILRDIHPLTTHFPIALLVVSVFLDVVARLRQSDSTGLRRASYITLILGAIAAVVTVITGNIALNAVGGENTAKGQLVNTHQALAVLSTLIFVVLAIWRFRSLRGAGDVSTRGLYLGVELLGVVGLVLTGLAGGNLVYTYGLGVVGAPIP
jgi:uncharacterized membrane protein